jgi:hypothetical protein
MLSGDNVADCWAGKTWLAGNSLAPSGYTILSKNPEAKSASASRESTRNTGAAAENTYCWFVRAPTTTIRDLSR